ncbi:hypothetical protein E2C01_064405 [Portunus trituberculatus]|uniref:Uncharacterized protein n=1 Tax=Portunus trituberculatus TaxID=210409 RepID=A0A5B7HKR0_PORTR|nr:hypothetical protein [Portunus trituberculatus]
MQLGALCLRLTGGKGGVLVELEAGGRGEEDTNAGGERGREVKEGGMQGSREEGRALPLTHTLAPQVGYTRMPIPHTYTEPTHIYTPQYNLIPCLHFHLHAFPHAWLPLQLLTTSSTPTQIPIPHLHSIYTHQHTSIQLYSTAYTSHLHTWSPLQLLLPRSTPAKIPIPHLPIPK